VRKGRLSRPTEVVGPLVVAFVLASVAAACSGASDSDLFGPSSGAGTNGADSGGGGGGDAGGGGTDAANDSPAPPVDSGPNPPKDSGVVVTESPAPTCHDLTQHGAFVVATATPSAPPSPNPLTTLAAGLYVATGVIEYQTTTTTEPAQKITVDVTPTRYYYLYETASTRQAITLDWSLADGTLTRDVLCSSSPTGGGPVKNRIDTAPNGYIIYTTSTQGHPLAIRYTRSN